LLLCKALGLLVCASKQLAGLLLNLACGLLDDAFDLILVHSDTFGLVLTTLFVRSLREVQSGVYSVVIPSKCSLSASASARVWWTMPSR
jgi:hypothetical protein